MSGELDTVELNQYVKRTDTLLKKNESIDEEHLKIEYFKKHNDVVKGTSRHVTAYSHFDNTKSFDDYIKAFKKHLTTKSDRDSIHALIKYLKTTSEKMRRKQRSFQD